jgi:hypothetical protein
MPDSRTLLAFALVFVLGALTASASRLHAEPIPAFDRNLVERMVRAEEAQARKLEDLVRAAERCTHGH